MKKELEFYGPLHFEQIEAPTGTIKDNYNKWPDPNKSGIYIWGFMYERHGDSLGNPVSFSIREIRYDSSSMQFIPYYVGIATGDSNVTINKRIKDHHNISHGNARKYTRLEWNYYPKFYKSFPISFKGKSNKEEFIRFVNDNPGKLIYFNNGEVN